jgi:hypothetical protein
MRADGTVEDGQAVGSRDGSKTVNPPKYAR